MGLTGHKLNSAQIEGCAANLESQNNSLTNTLEDSYNAIVNLKSTWKGMSAEATYSAFETFRENYFTNYKDAINQYVNFLRNVVIPSYQKTESTMAEAMQEQGQKFL